MAISKTKNYLVLNCSPSQVAISTKYESYLVPGGTPESPGTLPLTFDEIAVVNSTSPVFKIGLLRFEHKEEEEMYDALSIVGWRDILTEEKIEAILLHPTKEDLERILAIDNIAYFERIRGVLIGLKSAGVDVSNRIDNLIEKRRVELAKHQRKTAIQLVERQQPEEQPSKAEFDSMKKQLADMKAMMEKLLAHEDAPKQDANAAEKKPVRTNKGTRQKSDV